MRELRLGKIKELMQGHGASKGHHWHVILGLPDVWARKKMKNLEPEKPRLQFKEKKRGKKKTLNLRDSSRLFLSLSF